MEIVSSAFKEIGLDDGPSHPSGDLFLAILPSPNAMSQQPNSMGAETFQDSIQRAPVAKGSGSPANSSRSRVSGACQPGMENLFPSQNTSASTGHSSIHGDSRVFGSGVRHLSIRAVQTAPKLPYLVNEDHLDSLDPTSNIDQLPDPESRPTKLLVVNGDEEAVIHPQGPELGSRSSMEFDGDKTPNSPSLCSNRSPHQTTTTEVIIMSTPPKAMKRIADHVRGRHSSAPDHVKPTDGRQDLGDEFEPRLESAEHLEVPTSGGDGRHRKTSSGFSSMFVTSHRRAVKDLSSSSGDVSSRKSIRSRKSMFSLRISRLSNVANRNSIDSDQDSKAARHQASTLRAQQRRRIIGEMIDSESGYLNDLRILNFVYLAILRSTHMVDGNSLTKSEDNLLSIIALHEDLLVGMKTISKDFATPAEGRRTLPRKAKHIRYESIESLKSIGSDHQSLRGQALKDRTKGCDFVAEPQEAANVAELFGQMLGGAASTRMGKFSVYEAYGARYEEMLQACASASRLIPMWEVVERGIEALVNKVFVQGPVSKHDKRALTFEDLLIKPMQRICKYPLLFAELESYCPPIDDPESNGKIAKTLDRLREIAHEVNNAVNDLEAQTRLRRSQNLESLLEFPDTFRPSFSLIRDLGHAKLCGVLFVAYQVHNREVRGDFMLCALFDSHLLLASSGLGYKQFTINAIIDLHFTRLDVASSRQGLQSHETPYAWKMIFEADCQLYELLLCACTELEAERWKSGLQRAPAEDNQAHEMDDPLASNLAFLSLEVMDHTNKHKSVGTFRRGRFIRSFAKHNPNIQAVPVIIKNTCVPVKGDNLECQGSAAMSMERLNLHATTDPSQTLMPDKSHRIRMEQAMSEVWTRASIPYPGMTTSRSGQLIRASASMMRKLSKTSITSTPSKRSVSQRSRASTLEVCQDGPMDDPFVDHPASDIQHALDSIDTITEMPVIHDKTKIKETRKVSFSDDLLRWDGKNAKDDCSEASTVIGKPSGASGADFKGAPRTGNKTDELGKRKLLSRTFSRGRISGWFS